VQVTEREFGTGTPLQALYLAEILTSEIRAKGMAFQGFMGSAASFINQYATPIALSNIGWKTYTIFCKSTRVRFLHLQH
jgi:hypothetical protein